MDQKIEQLLNVVKESDNIVFFGGAGISTESHIPDFRSETGLYQTTSGKSYSPETMLSHSFYRSHTKEFYQFYKEKMLYPNAKPNKGHLALAKLEEMGKLKAVITQNIDGLHQLAGSKCVYELHGSVHRNYCTKCHSFYELQDILSQKDIPHCERCGGIIKPDVVLYEEALDEEVINKAIKAIQQAEVLIVGGTSLVVYPAAGLLRYFAGEKLVLINKSTTAYDKAADLMLQDSFGEVMEEVVRRL